LVFVSLKYCAEKRLLKTYVAFFMKVTVHNINIFVLEFAIKFILSVHFCM
jgi:hypothetical protein